MNPRPTFIAAENKWVSFSKNVQLAKMGHGSLSEVIIFLSFKINSWKLHHLMQKIHGFHVTNTVRATDTI